MRKLDKLLKKLYGDQAKTLLRQLPAAPKKRRTKDRWYKAFTLYVTYADSFQKNGKANFRTLANKLDYIQMLGCNAVHVLPFLESPLIDHGFDVSDYLRVRKELGGNAAFETFLREARKRDINVFMDLVLNHVSKQHSWFQEAQSGNAFYRKFFVCREKQPVLLRTSINRHGPVATYLYKGKQQTLPIIFPEQAGSIPHWIKGRDGYWYYHTFYPHQIDLEWNNPQVFLAFAKIIRYWAKKGLHFRLDAAPFLGKTLGKKPLESCPRTHLIMQALHQWVQQVNDSVFLVEVTQHAKIIRKYFGKKRVPEVELAYNFAVANGLWTSLVSEDAEPLWRTIEDTSIIPAWGQWVTFLRNHDELMLTAVTEKEKALLRATLTPKGLPHKKGFNIAGRTASFLDNDPKKILLAHCLLASIPGCPAIMYGDELGKQNDFGFMKKQAKLKRERVKDRRVKEDSREINRGIITHKERHTPEAKKLYTAIARMLNVRLAHKELFIAHPKRIKLPRHVFGAQYRCKRETLWVYANLGEKTVTIPLWTPCERVLAINRVSVTEDQIQLPAYAAVWLKSERRSAVQ